MPDPQTIEIYDARAGDYAEMFGADAPDAALSDFIAALPLGGRVLDLGCGPGRSAGLLARAGFAVEAWDASAAMVALARRQPGVSADQRDFDALDTLAPAKFDGVWANFSLLHAPRGAMQRHLAAIARALAPGGLLHLGLKDGDGTARDALGRLYTYWRAAEIEAALRGVGLEPGAIRRGTDAGLSGEIAPWFSLSARA